MSEAENLTRHPRADLSSGVCSGWPTDRVQLGSRFGDQHERSHHQDSGWRHLCRRPSVSTDRAADPCGRVGWVSRLVAGGDHDRVLFAAGHAVGGPVDDSRRRRLEHAGSAHLADGRERINQRALLDDTLAAVSDERSNCGPAQNQGRHLAKYCLDCGARIKRVRKATLPRRLLQRQPRG